MEHNECRRQSLPSFDLSAWTSDDGLPRPNWDLIFPWVEANVPSTQKDDMWLEIQRQWIEMLGPRFGPNFRAVESENFIVLMDRSDAVIDRFLGLAETCRHSLQTLLPGVADFTTVGKHVVLALDHADTYYYYLQPYESDDSGFSGGMHIRCGHPHVVVNAYDMAGAMSTLAHELTHVSLRLRSLPLWMEEGLAQMFEHDAVGRSLLIVNSEMARKHKKYWTKHGLEEFWSGDGFGKASRVQELSYQLAEIIVRLLVEDHRPRWFGLSRGKQQQLVEFLREASWEDSGAAAAEKHLGIPISELPAKFLGPGPWAEGLIRTP